MKDLNLLRVFEAVWTTRSVSRAAERLQLTQPAVSSSLARLRREFGDPLFSRIGTRMEPTPLCARQAPALLEALSLIQRSVAGAEEFDPATSTRTFVLRIRDVGEAAFLPHLLAHCRAHAPHLGFETDYPSHEESMQGLAAGRIDIVVGYLPDLETGIHRRELYSDYYVCVMRPGHPFARRGFGIKEMAASDLLLVDYMGTGHSVLGRRLREARMADRVKLRVPQFLGAPYIVASSDLVWIVPQLIARELQSRFELVIKACPLALPQVSVDLYWHDRFHRDPGNQWLRQTFATLFKGQFKFPA
jgi:DNA-binding transcriptional LysR family regulator